MNYDNFIDEWIRANINFIKTRSDTDLRLLVYERMRNFCINDPHIALQIVIKILHKTNDETILENLAAGPLETLLRYHCADTIDTIEDEANKDNRFKWLLAGVWQNKISDDLWLRISNACNNAPEKLPLF